MCPEGWWKWNVLCLEQESDPHFFHFRPVCWPCRHPGSHLSSHIHTNMCICGSLPKMSVQTTAMVLTLYSPMKASTSRKQNKYIQLNLHIQLVCLCTCLVFVAIVVVYTDLSGKQPPRQVGMGSMGKSGRLGGEMVSTLARNAMQEMWVQFPL